MSERGMVQHLEGSESSLPCIGIVGTSLDGAAGIYLYYGITYVKAGGQLMGHFWGRGDLPQSWEWWR